MRNKLRSLTIILLLSNVLMGYAQPNTMYFMDYLPYKTYMNPALQPKCNVFVELPGISTIGVSVRNNSLSMNDVIYPNDAGNMVTALDPTYGSVDDLYKTLNKNILTAADVNVSLFGFGWRLKNQGYVSINASLKVDALLNLPKDIFSLALYGTPDTLNTNVYDLDKLRATGNAYVDLSAGYSHKINDKWKVGGRLHLLAGAANLDAQFDQLSLQASEEQWLLSGSGKANASFPGLELQVDEDGKITGFTIEKDPMRILEQYEVCMGATLDLGLEYKPIKDLSISLSLTDLGFMYWQNKQAVNGSIDYAFEGVDYVVGEDFPAFGDSILAALQDSYTYDTSSGNYFTAMNAKLFVGAEYSFLKNMMSVGLLSKTELRSNVWSEEITLSYNLRPCSWIGISTSYSFFSGGFSTLGLGVNLRLPPFSVYVVSDYVPLYYNADGIPYKSEAFNVQAGIVLTIGCKTKRVTPYFEPTDF